jgi:uncharacterized protein (TIGR02217 family)
MVSTLFVDQRLDIDVEQNAQGGPTFLTTVIQLAGGTEKRNIEWSKQRLQWDLAYGVQSQQDLEAVQALFYICFGRARGFRFKDWSDYQIGDFINNIPTTIGVGTGSVSAYQAFRLYSIPGDVVSGDTFQRTITRLVQGTVVVHLNNTLKTEGVDYTVNYDTGVITFTVPVPNTVNVNLMCEFDVPVRFDTDSLKKSVIWTGAQSVAAIPIIELKEGP